MSTITVVCAGCETWLTYKPGHGQTGDSHSLCPLCEADILAGRPPHVTCQTCENRVPKTQAVRHEWTDWHGEGETVVDWHCMACVGL